jgi:small-conductance mechanosensitive channel
VKLNNSMKEIINYKLFEIGDFSIHVLVVAELILLIAATVIILSIIKKIFFNPKKIDKSRSYSIFKLVKYFIIIVSFVMSFRILGVDITVFLATFAALLVGIGLGLQNLFSDYVSGIIILFDSSVKVGDIIEVNGTVGRVIKIGLRTTTLYTRDDIYIILPNTILTKNELINWTYSEVTSRFDLSVGVDYSSNIDLVMKILKDASLNIEGILKQPVPFVRFSDYGDSAIIFTLYFWSDEVFRVENIKSQLRIKIFEEFKSNSIQIPFPQRVLYVKNKFNETTGEKDLP